MDQNCWKTEAIAAKHSSPRRKAMACLKACLLFSSRNPETPGNPYVPQIMEPMSRQHETTAHETILVSYRKLPGSGAKCIALWQSVPSILSISKYAFPIAFHDLSILKIPDIPWHHCASYKEKKTSCLNLPTWFYLSVAIQVNTLWQIGKFVPAAPCCACMSTISEGVPWYIDGS